MSLRFSHIYVEKRVLNEPYVKEILAKFPKAEIIEINHYKDRFNPYYQSFRAQKNSQSLILAKKYDLSFSQKIQLRDRVMYYILNNFEIPRIEFEKTNRKNDFRRIMNEFKI